MPPYISLTVQQLINQSSNFFLDLNSNGSIKMLGYNDENKCWAKTTLLPCAKESEVCGKCFKMLHNVVYHRIFEIFQFDTLRPHVSKDVTFTHIKT